MPRYWILGKPGIEKHIEGLYERIDQAESVKTDAQYLCSIELNTANSLTMINPEKVVEVPKKETVKVQKVAQPKRVVSKKRNR